MHYDRLQATVAGFAGFVRQDLELHVKERALQLLKQIEHDIAANRMILPSLPEVAVRVRHLLGNADCSITALEQQISKDAAMAARLLKVANSSIMSRGNKVSSLHHAIVNLGFSLVGSLVTQMAILQTMSKSRDVGRLEGFVASSLRISSLSHSIADQFDHLDPELASLGGLLHDIGKLPLREYLYSNPEFSMDERLQFELILHPYVGAILLKHWSMPDVLIQIAFYHERIMRDSPGQLPDYIDVVLAANLMHYGTDQGRYRAFRNQPIPALQKCLRTDRLAELEGSIEDRMEMALALIEN